MNYEKYIENKAKGLVEIKTAGDTVVMSTARFNEETGEKTQVEERIPVAEIQETIANLQKHIAGLQAILDDNQAKVEAVVEEIL